jgi:DNA invertase Pin-like site-specific DNA recombinase
MNDDLSPKAAWLHKRQGVERLLVKDGEQRIKLESELIANQQSIVDRLKEAHEVGIPFDGAAKLVGVSRQTLYRWQELARRQASEQLDS